MGIIYAVKNKLNGKYYIGMTNRTLEKRKTEHLLEAKWKRFDVAFYNAINKHGKDVFDWFILDEHSDKDILNAMEEFYIFKYDSYRKGYNSTTGGEGTPSVIYSKETCKKRSLAVMGDKNPNYHRKFSDEHRKKISDYHKNKILSDETKEKLRIAFSGSKNPFYGKKHDKSIMKKIRESQPKGLFDFRNGNYSHKNQNPWTKVWRCKIGYNNRTQDLGMFHDPLTCEIVYNFVLNEIT